MEIFSLQSRQRIRPSVLRSSVTKPMPALIASSGLRITASLPSMNTRPASFGSMPKMARAVSVRPAPTRPQIPTTSPLRASKLMLFRMPSRLIPSTRKPTSLMGQSRLGNCSFRSCPTMPRMRSSMVISLTFTVVIVLPSRMMVARSAICIVSSRRCEI